MREKLLAEFPEVSYESWREQVQKDLKGADFEKRLVSRTLEGIAVQPLYAAQGGNAAADATGFAGLPPYQRGGSSVGRYGALWDVRAEQGNPDATQAKADIADDLARGARSLWLRFDQTSRLGALAQEVAPDAKADGLACPDVEALAALLGDVALLDVAISFDAGGNGALAALLCAALERRGVALTSLSGSLGFDPLGALARDGALPYSLETARSLLSELNQYFAHHAPRLRIAAVSSVSYHDAGASSTQEIAYVLATGLDYVRWLLAEGVPIARASTALEFRVGVSSDLFLEIAKLRALRVCWAKVIAALGGEADAQNMSLHAVTAQRTKTQRDPWVNMLRTTTEAFSAMVGGADALTTRGFDEALGASDGFARRVARNTQTVLNEEAHVTRVADAAGGSFYIEELTDGLARAAWKLFQDCERRGGMSACLLSGAVAKDVAELADKRAAAVAKRAAAITGVSEFANLGEEPLRRERNQHKAAAANAVAAGPAAGKLAQLSAASPPSRIAIAVEAARQGANIAQITTALAGAAASARCEALPVRRQAEAFEALRTRVERHAAGGGTAPRAFLCNLGTIPQHKARASFATGFLAAGGVGVVDNDGFASPELALAGFEAAATPLVVICGSDDQYPEWVPKLTPLLRERGATQVILAGRPGEHEVSYQQAGVSSFIFMSMDVVATLKQLLDSLGVAP